MESRPLRRSSSNVSALPELALSDSGTGSAGIRLNTDLARKPRECLEYIVAHEMAHLLEPTHNSRFSALKVERFFVQGILKHPARHSCPFVFIRG